MSTQLTIYKPNSEQLTSDPISCDIAITAMNNNHNISASIARKLHVQALAEMPQTTAAEGSFKPNIAYEMGGGLVFRLFDDGHSTPTLEFMAIDNKNPAKAAESLQRIPGLLQRAGVEAASLIELRSQLPQSSSRSPG